MIQEIYPRVYDNSYKKVEPNDNSIIFLFKGRELLLKREENKIIYPCFVEFADKECKYQFLFSIDSTNYFLSTSNKDVEIEDYTFEDISFFREAKDKEDGFAAITAYQLYLWYKDNQYCGRCKSELKHSDKERMLYCNECNNTIYPKISPAVIVGVIHQDKILVSKYAGREYNNYALLAGFSEIGEPLEDTVRREVMEEVGLRVKNLTYYKSQPWSLSGCLLVGFFAELDGSDEITLDEEELSEALWLTRDEITLERDDISITREMIMWFKEHKDNER